MTALLTISYSFEGTFDRAREEGRQEARRRLAGHRGYSTTMSAEELAALSSCDDGIDSGRVGSPIDEPNG